MQYIGAGLNPARFWEITPRLFSVEMEGAALRIQREREMVWWGAMLPHLKKPVPLKDFIGKVDLPKSREERAKAFHDAWDRIDRALARG